MRTPHSQTEVIDVLRSSSTEFQDFYSHNQTLIEELRIRWFENPDLVNGRCKPLLNGAFEIELKRIPPPDEAAFIVAHEMYHCLLWQQGYPRLKPVDKAGLQIVGDIQSMVYDHYIHRRSSTDFSNGCSAILLIFQHFFETHLNGKTNIEKEFETRLLFVYVNCDLSLDVLCNGTQIEQNDLLNWVKTYRTDFVEKGGALISQIQDCDFNNKLRVGDLFDQIFVAYDLSSHILVRK